VAQANPDGRCANGERDKIFDRCTFVIFNYDRCVEHFFLEALQRSYDITSNEAVDIIAKARIYHPYGLAGELDDATTTGGMVPFGAEQVDCYSVGAIMLKTYTESVESKQIKSAVAACEQIVFLGFAYHDQNMRLLADDDSLDKKKFIGTALKMSASDIGIIKPQIDGWQDRLPSAAIMPNYGYIDIDGNLTAAEIFYHYSKSL
jgi:hypothetical protein